MPPHIQGDEIKMRLKVLLDKSREYCVENENNLQRQKLFKGLKGLAHKIKEIHEVGEKAYRLKKGLSEVKKYNVNYKDMSSLYKSKPDGIRRCQMLEIIINLALLYFPTKRLDIALYSYLR